MSDRLLDETRAHVAKVCADPQDDFERQNCEVKKQVLAFVAAGGRFGRDKNGNLYPDPRGDAQEDPLTAAVRRAVDRQFDRLQLNESTKSMSFSDEIYAHNVQRQLAEMRAEDAATEPRADASCSCPDARADAVDNDAIMAEVLFWERHQDAPALTDSPARADSAGSASDDDAANVVAELEHLEQNAWGQ